MKKYFTSLVFTLVILATLLGMPSVSSAATFTAFATTPGYLTNIVLDAAGNLYSGNYINNATPFTKEAIMKITPSGVVSTFAALNFMPTGLVMDTAGNLYTIYIRNAASAPTDFSKIMKITPSGAVTTFATIGGQADAANLTSGVPVNLAFGPAGNLYVAQYNDDGIPYHRAIKGTIIKITPSGTVTTFATVGVNPSSLVFDTAGNLYVGSSNYYTWGGPGRRADETTPVSCIISKITPSGTVTTFMDTLTNYCAVGALAIDTAGTLYSATQLGINKITPSGIVTSFPLVAGPITNPSTGVLYFFNGGLAIADDTPYGFHAAAAISSVGYTRYSSAAFDTVGNNLYAVGGTYGDTIFKASSSIGVQSNVSSSWTITGPATVTGSGYSQSTLSKPAGVYAITWGAVPGYVTPVTQTLTLDIIGDIAFSGIYKVANAIPTVTSPTSISITQTSATLGANVTSLGVPASISARGICWGTTVSPTTNCTPEGLTTTGVFTQTITGLSPNTTYYYRGYTTNTTGTAYSADGLFLKMDLSNISPFAATESKVFTLSGSFPTIPNGYMFTITNYDGVSISQIPSSTPSFTHDFRKVLPTGYRLSVTDPFGNTATGTITVVADVPADTIGAYPITGSAQSSSYTSTFTGSQVADAIATHSMSMKLRDQYGNPVITEPGIKTVNVRVALDNNVDQNEIDPINIGGGNANDGDAISYNGSIHPLYVDYQVPMSFGGTGAYQYGTDDNTTGDYTLNISSYAPTKAGYAFTTPNNDISLQKLSYEVTPATGISGVGETGGQIEKKDKIGTSNLLFSPALYIGSVTNSDNWSIIQGYNTNFIATLLNTTTVSLITPKVAHILNIDSNLLLSYQNPLINTGGTEICNGYMKTVSTGMGSYTLSGGLSSNLCNRPDLSSNILMTPATLSSTMDFSWKPTIILASPANSTVTYASEISYMNGTTNVTYPSYGRSNNSALSATGAVIAPAFGITGSGVTNQSVKILGISNSNNIFNTLSGSTTNNISSLTRVDIKNVIHKNVEIMTRGSVPVNAKYMIYTLPTISDANWPMGKDTIIVQGGDITIDGNITSGAAMKSIIVLQDAAGAGGNIYIKKNVSNIAAVLFTDKSILSGELIPAKYYSDIVPSLQTATGQLFIEGSIISNNTIGGASMTPLKCPYNVTGCTDVIAKRYDFNYFRFYQGIGATSLGASNPPVPVGSETYPFVIRYDNRLQIAPPPGFSIK